MNASHYTPIRQRRGLRGENYVLFISLVVASVGLIHGYMEMMTYLLLRDENFLEYITTNSRQFGSYYATVYYYGIISGALVGYKFSDSIGRRTALICSCALVSAVISWAASCDTQIVVIISRFITGLGIGGMLTTAVIYIAELSPPETRGRHCALLPLMSIIGASIALVISQLTLEQSDSWRLCVAFPVMPALVALVGLMFSPESPWWLLANRTPADGLASLEQLRRVDEVTGEFKCMYRALSYDATQENTLKSLMYGDISLRYRLGLVCILQFVRALSCERLYYEFGGKLLRVITRGHHQKMMEAVAVAVIFCTAFAGAISGCMSVDAVGRKNLLLTSLPIMVVAGGVCTWMVHLGHMDFLGVTALTDSEGNQGATLTFTTYLAMYFYSGTSIMYCYFSYLSLATCSSVITVELFPLRARAKAVSIASAVYYLGVILVHYLKEFLESQEEVSLSTGVIWTTLSVILALFGIYVFFAYPETTGIVFEDADELFDIEEYDAVMWCFPRGTGSGYLGFRSLSHSGSRFHVYRNSSARTKYNSNDMMNIASPQQQSDSSSRSASYSLFPSLSFSQQSFSGDHHVPGGLSGINLSSINGLELDGGGSFLTLAAEDSHKYSEDMRHSDFQYVHNQDMVSLHATPLFK